MLSQLTTTVFVWGLRPVLDDLESSCSKSVKTTHRLIRSEIKIRCLDKIRISIRKLFRCKEESSNRVWVTYPSMLLFSLLCAAKRSVLPLRSFLPFAPVAAVFVCVFEVPVPKVYWFDFVRNVLLCDGWTERGVISEAPVWESLDFLSCGWCLLFGNWASLGKLALLLF